MAVHIFEAIERAVARRHQLDHAFLGMRGHARRLVKILPATEIFLHITGKFLKKGLNADAKHQLHHMIDADERNDIEVRLGHHCSLSIWQPHGPRQ